MALAVCITLDVAWVPWRPPGRRTTGRAGRTVTQDAISDLDLPVYAGEQVEYVGAVDPAAPLVSWILDGIERDETVVLITSSTLAMRLLDTMKTERLPVARLLGEGRIQMVAASLVVRAVTEGGDIDRTLYDALVGRLLERIAAQGRMRILSEMTDEAVRQLGPEAALQVELAWERVIRQSDGAVLTLSSLEASRRSSAQSA